MNWIDSLGYNKCKSFLIMVAACSMCQFVKGQLSIQGPSCVIAGVEYQYLVTGRPDSITSMRICVTGGAFARSGLTCSGDTVIAEARIIWGNVSTGTITLSTAAGNISKTVVLTHELQAGIIDATQSMRIIRSDSIPSPIVCSAATGGGCTAVYVYQWQKSSNNLEWSDISGATAPQLVFSAPPGESAYYRRKVTETNSGTIAYSTVAAIFVEPVAQ